VAAALVALGGLASAQLCPTGSTTFGGAGDDFLGGLAVGSSNELYLAGGTDSFGAGSVDALLLRYEADGSFGWARTWGGAGDESADAFTLDLAGALLIAGPTSSFGPSADVFLAKLDGSGTEQWGLTWNTGADEEATTVFTDAAGNVFVGGCSSVLVGAGEDALLLRFPATSGTTAPSAVSGVRIFGDAAADELINSGTIDGSSGTEFVVTAGNWTSHAGGGSDVLVARYDTVALGLVWARRWGGPGDDAGDAVALDGTGNFYVAGETSSGVGGLDVLVQKWDASGTLLWAIAWGGTGDEGVGYVSQDAAGNLYLAGETTSFGSGGQDGLLLAASPAGQVLWSMTWGGAQSLEGLGLERPKPSAGPVRAAGFSDSAAPVFRPVVGTTTSLSLSTSVPTGITGTPLGLVTPVAATKTSPPNGRGSGIELYVYELDQGCYPTYCQAGTSAAGCTAAISGVGTPSATLPSGFVLSTTGVQGQKDGLYFYGTNGRQQNPWGNGTSFQCVVPPVKRGGLLSGTGTIGACDGVLVQDLNARFQARPAHNPGPGAVMQAQLWYRDPQNTSNQTTSLSDAVEFVVAP